MAERFVKFNGTISVASGTATVIGTGTTFGDRNQEGNWVVAYPPTGPQLVGVVASVDPRGQYQDLELPLLFQYDGPSLSAVEYSIVDGPAMASGTEQAAIYLRFASFLDRNMGLAGNEADQIEWALVPNNTLFVNNATRALSQWRNGVLTPVQVVGASQTFRGEWDDQIPYLANDTVSWNGALFVSNLDNNENNEPVTSPEPESNEWWTIYPAPPGIPGEPGPPGAGIVPTGAWSAVVVYDPGESVSHGTPAGSYVAIEENTGVEPGVTAGWETYWQIVADPGADGRTVHSVSGDPGNGLGEDGDYAIDPSTSTLYGPKTGGVWPAGVSLVGAAGLDGATILTGAGAPAPGVGTDGDLYLDTTTNDVYQKVSGSWGTPVTNIEGDEGTAATITIGDVTTVGPDDPATVTNVGTANAAEFDFEIPRGQPGVAATVTVDSTVTLAPGDDALVTNEGTTSAAAFKFSIPRGDKGDPGTAARITVGDVTTVGPSDPATVTNVGTSTAAEFDFEIPRGQPGAAATITVDSTVTLAPGENAVVTNEGTTSAAAFKFSIPRGDKGEPGTAATITVGDVTTVGPDDPATVTNVGTSTAAEFDFEIPQGIAGDNGWTPMLATVTDGERRVHQVVDWTGGEGTKPATGLYVGATGLVANIVDGVNIRGSAGTGSGDMQASVYDPQNVNDDAFNRANHTGTQAISTITGLQDELDDKADTASLGTAAFQPTSAFATAAQGALADTAVQPGDLADVATSGDYDDLDNKPTLGTAAAADTGDFATAAQGALADTAVQPGDLADVATSGDYNDLDNLPTIPPAQVPADWDATTGVARILNKPSAFPPAAHTHNASDINAGTLAIARIPTGTTGSTVALGNHTHGTATTGAPGFMSATDKAKLDGIPANATANTGTVTSVAISVPTGFSVTGSPITSAGTFTVSYASGYQGYTSAEAAKLSGIEAGADVTDAANVAAAGAAMLAVENQPLTGGATVTSKSLGTITSGTVTLDMGDRPLQHLTRNGAFTLAPGSVNGMCVLDITNGASAGALTTSGWTQVAGDDFTTTNGHKFRCHCSVGNGGSLLVVQALQ